MTVFYIICTTILLIFAFRWNIIAGVICSAAILAYAVYSYIPTYWAVRAQKVFADGNFKRAKYFYKKSMDTGRAKLQIRINYAHTLMRTGDFEEAERVLDNVIRIKNMKKPEFKKTAKQQRCMVYYKEGRLEEALEEAYELFNDGFVNTAMYGILGYLRLVHGDNIDEVTKFCEEAYDYNSDDRDIMDNLSLCYYAKGEYEKAKELSDKILEDAPKFVEAYYHGAQIAVKLGEYERARELLTHTDGCRWSTMTTVSHEEIEELNREISRHIS